MAKKQHLDAKLFADPENIAVGEWSEIVRPSPYEVPTSVEISVDEDARLVEVLYRYSGSPRESFKKIDLQEGVMAWIGRNSNRLYEIRIADEVGIERDRNTIRDIFDAALDRLIDQVGLQKRIHDNYKIAKQVFDNATTERK